MTRPEDTPNEALELALCGPDERAEQARLFNACFKKALEAPALVWRYDENPHGRAVSLVARPPGGEGISGYACSPRLASAGGDESSLAAVGETGDVMTHPAWRKRGIFSGLDVRAMEETRRLGWPMVFGLPNRKSAHIFLELGWEKVGTIRPWTLYLDAGKEARALRLADGRLRALQTPLAALAWRKARRRLRHEAAGRYGVQTLARFPEEVAELSREVERDFAWMVRRDAAYLDWRFIRNTSGLHRALGAYDREGVFAGYAVVQLPREGSGLGYLVDLLARDDSARATLLEGAVQHLATAGAVAVRATAIDGSWWSEVLADAAFQQPKPENHLTVIVHIHDESHPLAEAARRPERWYLTDGDRDDETMG